MPNNLQNNTGSYIPTTFIWDADLIRDTNVNSNKFKELLVELYQNISDICKTINSKDTAIYPLQEFLNSQTFFPNQNIQDTIALERQVFRIVINFGALPNATSLSIPHGIEISNDFSFTRIYGTASNQITMQYIPIPYASSTLANNIQLDVDATNVTITTGIDWSSYNVSYVILEYIKE